MTSYKIVFATLTALSGQQEGERQVCNKTKVMQKFPLWGLGGFYQKQQ